MSIFGRIASWFSSKPTVPTMCAGGKRIAWAREVLPVNVWVDESMSTMSNAEWSVLYAQVGTVNCCFDAGRALLMPVALLPDTRNAFFGSRETFTRAIVIQPYRLVGSDPEGAFQCTTDMRWDKRDGRMRNAVIEWNLAGDAGDGPRLLHELGHAVLGLGHGDGIMQARLSNWAAVVPAFTSEQIKAAREGLKP